jgi:predicted ATP-dependent endonuclease of OLD family
MFILKSATINKYKSYTSEQTIQIESDVTTLVGKNESGKTAFLESLAKLNYFTEDEYFNLNSIHDYPRSELKKFKKSESDVSPIVCTFLLDEETIDLIKEDLGEGVLTTDTFKVSSRYNNGRGWYYLNSDEKKYLEFIISKLECSDNTSKKLLELGDVKSVIEYDYDGDENNEGFKAVVEHITTSLVNQGFDWKDHRVDAYITQKYIQPKLPRFWYFDEYHELPSRVSIEAVSNNQISGELTKQQLDTAKALFELAMINIDELNNSTDFESFIAELEATSNEITDTIFEYWSTNANLAIEFKIDQIHRDNQQAEKILDIRVKNNRHRITLPLKNRSKGFNWFFSFIVWFSRIQDDKDNNFILLLDEPGLNLHASAQGDLLRFINDLSSNYQVIYSTHSPFMVESDHLNRVRTVYDSDEGSIISDAIQEKDPDTLFPLQAALGYHIAQNLFVSKNNLLVEGPADLNYLTYMSNVMETSGREGLKDDITIVPVGGLDKVTSFISLLRGSKLNIVCLLDSFNNDKGAQRLDNLIQSKIIKNKNVRFFDEFAGEYYEKADVEDMFSPEEYLKVFVHAFPEHEGIVTSDLIDKNIPIITKLNEFLKVNRFNHYKPSNSLLIMGLEHSSFSKVTLDNFEFMFQEINKLF